MSLQSPGIASLGLDPESRRLPPLRFGGGQGVPTSGDSAPSLPPASNLGCPIPPGPPGSRQQGHSTSHCDLRFYQQETPHFSWPQCWELSKGSSGPRGAGVWGSGRMSGPRGRQVGRVGAGAGTALWCPSQVMGQHHASCADAPSYSGVGRQWLALGSPAPLLGRHGIGRDAVFGTSPGFRGKRK